MTDFQLTPQEQASNIWLRLAGHLNDRLASARVRNDAALSESETAALRGEIKCLKRILALGASRPILTDD